MTRFHEEGADRLLLLGDLLYHGPRNPLPEGYAPAEVAKLLSGYADRITAVRGNCDAEVDQMVLDFPCLGDYALVVDADTTLMLTHGHLELSRVVAGLPAGSFVLSGHTHVKGIGTEVAPAFVKDAGCQNPAARRSSRSLPRAVRTALSHLRQPRQYRPPQRRLRQHRRWDNGTIELRPLFRLSRADQGQPYSQKGDKAVSTWSEIINEKSPRCWGPSRSYGGRRGLEPSARGFSVRCSTN